MVHNDQVRTANLHQQDASFHLDVNTFRLVVNSPLIMSLLYDPVWQDVMNLSKFGYSSHERRSLVRRPTDHVFIRVAGVLAHNLFLT
jgi:hypothetical protein